MITQKTQQCNQTERFIYYLLLYYTMENNLIKPITVEINKELWEKFKSTVNRDKTLNQALIELINKEVNGDDKL
jgi:hypothetical protein